MSEAFLDRHLIHNSSLACFLLLHFVGQYQQAAPGRAPDLPKLMLVLPLVWNEAARNELAKRNARSAFSTVLRDTPVLKVDLQQRVTAHTGATLQGLNLAVSSRLLGKIGKTSEAATFQVLVDSWPRGIKKQIPDKMMQVTERLAKWFATEPTENLYKLMFGIPYEVYN